MPLNISHKTILIITDSNELRTLLRHNLEQEGFDNILEADSASQAFKILDDRQTESDDRSSAVDLILMDLTITNIDGDATCSKLTSRPQTASVPVIIMAAPSEGGKLENALEQGALDYINNPINKIELMARVKSALLLKEERDKNTSLNQKLNKAHKKLESTALTDNLTGIANRRYFNEFLDKEWRRCRREQQTITLCLVDIDFFMIYNEFNGHLQGDECLKTVSTILSAKVKRPGDLVARYGDDQFALVLSETPEAGGCMVAKLIMEAMANRNIPHEHSSISDRITLSIGVAMLAPKAATTVHDLITQANRALFEAKHMGRNQIRCPCLKNPTQP